MVQRRLAIGLFLALLPGAVAHVASCSDPDPVATTDATVPVVPVEAGTVKPDAAVAEDVFVPGPVRKPPQIPSCLGETRPMKSSGEKVYVAVNMSPPDAGAPAQPAIGDFLLDFGSNGSSIDLAGGFKTTPPPIPAQCLGDAAVPGASCSFNHFDFFGPWGTIYLPTADYGILFSSIRQSGIIGTDFLSNYPFTLDYLNARIYRGSKTAFCSDAQLLGAGYAPIPTGGFYVNDTSKLRPLSDVVKAADAAATQGIVVPNVPTVPITIGGVAALAQLDTGYDDRVNRHSLNINIALLNELRAKDFGLLERAPDLDLFLTTCVPGLNQKAEAWRLRAGTPVNFVSQGGSVGRQDLGNVVFVKDATPEAARCGGIDTWTEPAAQMGASFLFDAYVVIFDPFTSRVWIPK
jgi:hypothetical protein